MAAVLQQCKKKYSKVPTDSDELFFYVRDEAAFMYHLYPGILTLLKTGLARTQISSIYCLHEGFVEALTNIGFSGAMMNAHSTGICFTQLGCATKLIDKTVTKCLKHTR